MSNEQVTVGDGPASHAETITPSDTTPIPSATRSLYVGSSGDVAVVMASGEAVTFVSVPAGVVLPGAASQGEGDRNDGPGACGAVVRIAVTVAVSVAVRAIKGFYGSGLFGSGRYGG
jgi:hypothetical protein